MTPTPMKEGVVPFAVLFVLAILLLGRRGYEPRRFSHCYESPEKTARSVTLMLTHEAFTAWSARDPRSACPPAIAALDDYINDTLDPWHHRYWMHCNPDPAPGELRVVFASPGPDGMLGTTDDIASVDDHTYRHVVSAILMRSATADQPHE